MAGKNQKNGMTGKSPQTRERPARVLLLLVWLGLVWLQVSGCSNTPLPAQEWNVCQLKLLKANPPENPAFAVLGDSRGSRRVFSALLKKLNEDPEVAFVIHLGDVVDQPELEQYRLFFSQVREHLFKPLLVTVGNHELVKEGRPLYRRLFGPENYAFSLGKAYFIIFDNARLDSLNEASLRWLAEELEKARAYPWRLVFLHVPLFDPRGGEHRHCLPPEWGWRLADLFRRGGVSHIFAGHIHGYFNGEWASVPFTISGGGGAKLYGEDPGHFFHHAVKVALRSGKLDLEVKKLPPQMKERTQMGGKEVPLLAAGLKEPRQP
uniref:Calcineurin-like phosphoesterase domain-containing protein n=1 Tax=Desulfobacca acetoxidans TaxID=60893 RepID=A0A7C5EP55_9BACT